MGQLHLRQRRGQRGLVRADGPDNAGLRYGPPGVPNTARRDARAVPARVRSSLLEHNEWSIRAVGGAVSKHSANANTVLERSHSAGGDALALCWHCVAGYANGNGKCTAEHDGRFERARAEWGAGTGDMGREVAWDCSVVIECSTGAMTLLDYVL